MAKLLSAQEYTAIERTLKYRTQAIIDGGSKLSGSTYRTPNIDEPQPGDAYRTRHGDLH